MSTHQHVSPDDPTGPAPAYLPALNAANRRNLFPRSVLAAMDRHGWEAVDYWGAGSQAMADLTAPDGTGFRVEVADCLSVTFDFDPGADPGPHDPQTWRDSVELRVLRDCPVDAWQEQPEGAIPEAITDAFADVVARDLRREWRECNGR